MVHPFSAKSNFSIPVFIAPTDHFAFTVGPHYNSPRANAAKFVPVLFCAMKGTSAHETSPKGTE
jgi:hypothetical protein